MIKADIINQMSSKAGISKAAAEKALKVFTDG